MQDEEYTSGYGEPSKAYRIVKGCFKGILYGASALVWILVFYVIFTTRESKLMDQMIFTDRTQNVADKMQEEGYRVYQLYPADFMNRDGSIELGNIYYSQETRELEIGIKYNKKLTDGNTQDGIRYVLTDQDGTEYHIIQSETDAIGRYGYARICFEGLDLPVEETDDWELRLTLSLYQKDSDEPLSTYLNADRTEEVNNATFLIYTETTVTGKTKFDG